MQKLLESALEQVPVGVLIARAPDGRVVYANARAAELNAGEGDTDSVLAAPIEQALAGIPSTNLAVSRPRADGSLAWYDVDATPLRAEGGGQVTGVVVAVRHAAARQPDLSRNSASAENAGADGQPCRDPNARIERLDPVHTRLLAVLSHEVRTPLTAVVGYSDMLDAELAGPLTAAQRHQVERIRTSAWQTISVLEQTLTYASAGAGDLQLQRTRVDLCEVVRDAALLHRADAERRGVRIECELPATPVFAWTDEARVRQIIAHLVCNAVRYTDGVRVRVVGRRTTGGFRTIVQDDGPGIDSGKRGVLFELFQRDGVQHSDAAGAGLGLPLSRQLARLLGGELALDEPAGPGSRFVLDLPIAG